jgi:hypothetical protein
MPFGNKPTPKCFACLRGGGDGPDRTISGKDKDLALLSLLADRVEELLAQFANLAPGDREYTTDLTIGLTHLVEAYRRKLLAVR